MPVLLLLPLLLLIRYENLYIDQPFFSAVYNTVGTCLRILVRTWNTLCNLLCHFGMRANKDNIMQPHCCLKNLQENLFEEVDNLTIVVKLHGFVVNIWEFDIRRLAVRRRQLIFPQGGKLIAKFDNQNCLLDCGSWFSIRKVSLFTTSLSW